MNVGDRVLVSPREIPATVRALNCQAAGRRVVRHLVEVHLYPHEDSRHMPPIRELAVRPADMVPA